MSDGVEMDIPESVQVVRVPADVMESISPMQTPQGALFLCRLPEKKEFEPVAGMLLLDGIQLHALNVLLFSGLLATIVHPGFQ